MYKEQECIGAIVRTFSHLKTYTQFSVGPYRLDLYIPDYDLAIECNELNHSDRDPKKEEERTTFIKSDLNCEFIRFNPDGENFSTYEVIGSIVQHIEKRLQHETNKLKLENKFLEGFYNAVHYE